MADMKLKRKGKKWIKGAIKHKGSFTKSAKAAGKSVQEYAEEKKHVSGKVGQRARLSLVLKGMHHSKGK